MNLLDSPHESRRNIRDDAWRSVVLSFLTSASRNVSIRNETTKSFKRHHPLCNLPVSCDLHHELQQGRGGWHALHIKLSSRFFAVVASSFCTPGKPSHGTQGMEFGPDSRWVGPNHSRAPTQIREVAQFEASQQHSSNSPRRSQSRAVAEFSQCRHESPQYAGSSGGVGRRRNQCTGRVQAAVQRAKPVSQPSARFSRSPDITMVEARLNASKLEQALDALEGTNGAEVDAIKKALVKAEAAAHEKPLTEIADCKGFIDRAEK